MSDISDGMVGERAGVQRAHEPIVGFRRFALDGENLRSLYMKWWWRNPEQRAFCLPQGPVCSWEVC